MIDFGIIAAGEGSRIFSEGSSTSKPMLRIGGVPMIGRLVKIMEKCNAGSISIIINENMPEVHEYLLSLIPNPGCYLRIISASTPSSMHSFSKLVEAMHPVDKFIVTTVDTVFCEENFINYSESFDNSPKDIDGLMGVTSYIDDEKPLYVNTNEKMKILAFSDNREEDKEETKYISAGVYGLKESSISILEKCMNEGVSRMRNFQRMLVNSGLNLKAYDLGKVIDVDHLSDVGKADALLSCS